MKKVFKGDFGYIEYRKKVAIIRTVACVAIVLAVFFTGLIIYKSQKSIFSIIAAVLCLPTGWSGVNLIMFLKAKACSNEYFAKIEKHKGDLLIHYDHIITSYDKNFYVAASTVLDKNICCLAADKDMEETDCEKHIRKMLAASGYSSYSIKVFTDINKFCERLDQLEVLRSDKNIDPYQIEESWVPGTNQTPAAVLLSISL